jgi:C-terminal processing protease CtpA/Prc
MYPARWTGFFLVALLLAGCGGGGGDGGGGGGGNTPAPPWTAGVFEPSSTFDAMCAQPRNGTDPSTGQPYPDVQATTAHENHWLRSWTNELYLWYAEVADANPALYGTLDYFDLMMTSAVTPSGNPKDQFHFTYPTADWFALSQSGEQAGYGAAWVIIEPFPPRRLVVAFTEPASPATAPAVNLVRGAEVLRVDGVDLVNDNTQAGVDVLNAGLFPPAAGQMHTFRIRDPGGAERDISMTSANITSDPVQFVKTIPTATGEVGYMLFNDHVAPAEQDLIAAFTTLQAAGIVDLVLDIRYNGGGFLDIASEVAFMIAGPARTAGQTFELLQFNDKHPTRDPVTGDLIAPIPFYQVSQDFSGPANQALPTVNLGRVFVLTGPDTCSASESIINSLRGVNVDVIQIGSTTCGKPYGFYPFDNCGTTYFSIQFKGVNAQNFGDYADGFTPQNAVAGTAGERIPGCSVQDDFAVDLGDVQEDRLEEALRYRTAGSCTAPPSGMGRNVLAAATQPTDGRMFKSPWHSNRILRH